MASSSGLKKFCFNTRCQEALVIPKAGWQCQNGHFAELCDGCASAFDAQQFCDIYHSDIPGWRFCDSCDKPIHCGCIVSLRFHILLDDGGMKCLPCSTRDGILTATSAFQPTTCPNTCPSSTALSRPDPHGKAPMFEEELDPRTPFETDVHANCCTMVTRDGLSASPVRESERMNDDSWGRMGTWFLQFDESETAQDNNTDGVERDGQLNLPVNDQITDQEQVSEMHVQQPTDEFATNNNGRKARGRNHRLSHYSPKVTNRELQQIAGDSTMKITPLFEKMLTVSDAGKIGRLVLPKKCAEEYFPQINDPEGMPIEIKDTKGKNWKFQFRFWPNSNSRMYVLEGFSPCTQAMKLQAGDTVIFSRLESEGTLLMGFRRTRNAHNSSISKGNLTASTSIGFSKGKNIASDMLTPVSHRNSNDQESHRSEVVRAKYGICAKRKRSSMGQNSKRTQSDGLRYLAEEEQPKEIDNMFLEINQEAEAEAEAEPEPLEVIADLAAEDETTLAAPPQVTTKHPRHRPGCTCIVCVQAPSGTRHETSCDCTGCRMLKRRRGTLKSCRGNKHAGKVLPKSTQQPENIDNLQETESRDLNNKVRVDGGSDSCSKTQIIDLNLNPDDEDDDFPACGSTGAMKLIQVTTIGGSNK